MNLPVTMRGTDTILSLRELRRSLLMHTDDPRIRETVTPKLLARTERSRIAEGNLRANAGGGTRPDAVFFCLDALQKFQALGEVQTKTITFEIAMLGRQGLDINDPSKKYTLRSLPGQFTGLHLVSLLYTGMQRIAPNTDAGIDLSRELAQAKALLSDQTNPPKI